MRRFSAAPRSSKAEETKIRYNIAPAISIRPVRFSAPKRYRSGESQVTARMIRASHAARQTLSKTMPLATRSAPIAASYACADSIRIQACTQNARSTPHTRNPQRTDHRSGLRRAHHRQLLRVAHLRGRPVRTGPRITRSWRTHRGRGRGDGRWWWRRRVCVCVGGGGGGWRRGWLRLSRRCAWLCRSSNDPNRVGGPSNRLLDDSGLSTVTC